MKNWDEIYAEARKLCDKCRCCPICNGMACRGETPGPGGKGSGSAFIRNTEMLKKIFINMDTITDNREIDTHADFFGHSVSLPVYAAPISGIRQNYGADMDDITYTKELVSGCVQAGTFAFTGDGMHDEMFTGPLEVVREQQGLGVVTIKPWSKEHMEWRMAMAASANVIAIASDIDASGLTNLRNSVTPVGFKTVDDLIALKKMAKVPFLLKGILSVKGAEKALAAGADGIIVSNHGGRVLDDCQSGIEVLEDIVNVVAGRMKILVDGGFRTGNDVFKALALGADGVLLGRTISHAVIGGGAEGVIVLMNKIALELKEAMALSGCKKITNITRDHVTVKW